MQNQHKTAVTPSDSWKSSPKETAYLNLKDQQ